MKFIVVLVIFFMDLFFGINLSAQSYSDETSQKLWGKYLACRADLQKKSMVIFEEKSAICLKNNPQLDQEKCDEIAEENVSKWKDSQEFMGMCEQYRPTTYTPKNDEYDISYVGSTGGEMAAVDGNYKVAIKIFEECVAVGDLECYFKLGQMKLYGIGIEKDTTSAMKLLKYASEHGHEEATQIIDNPDL